MLFTSPSFLLIFLPIFFLVFRSVSSSGGLTGAAKLTIVVGTYLFYGFENVGYLIPFILATFMDLAWSHALKHARGDRLRRWIVAASVVQNLALLCVYKYVNWLSSTFPGCATLAAVQSAFADESGQIALPPGVSFYLFESMSFVIDCYRRKIETPKKSLDFLMFISMFPRFIAGPIVRYSDLEASILRYRGPRMADGFFVFAVGFSAKILIADSFARFIEGFFGNSFLLLPAWTVALAYSFQLYVDFAGYSLMAIGLGLALGFPFPDNFREPYLAQSITEFWRRWHVSLSTWLRDYLYVSLGGNRVGPRRLYANLFLTMTLGGLWHGANVTFVIWGAYHGALLALERALRTRGLEIRSRFLTFTFVCIGWVYFRAHRASEGERTLHAMLGLNGIGWPVLRLNASSHSVYALCFAGLVWIFWLEPLIRRMRADAPWSELSVKRVPSFALVATLAAFAISVLLALSSPKIPFLYFQF